MHMANVGITVFMILGIFLYIALAAGFFLLMYFILKRAIKNGLIEAYKEIERLKQSNR